MAKLPIPMSALCAAVVPAAASACDVAKVREPTVQENVARAKFLLSKATLVVDGEVVEPETMPTPARVRVVHWFRGPKVACFDMFMTKGERRRFVMIGGPVVYRTSTMEISSNREVDRMLGSDRRKDWPYYLPPAGVGRSRSSRNATDRACADSPSASA